MVVPKMLDVKIPFLEKFRWVFFGVFFVDKYQLPILAGD